GIAALITAVTIGVAHLINLRRPSLGHAWSRIVLLVGVAYLAIPLGSLAQHAYTRFQSNSTIFEAIRQNFTHPDPDIPVRETGAHNLRVLVYIGESTTSLHWSLYGYPRDTTPQLDAFQQHNPGFLVFHNVMSTQVMTSPSLLEALSLQWTPGPAHLPINVRHRLSSIDVLRHLSLPSQPFSIQSASASYSLGGRIIFRHADRVDY